MQQFISEQIHPEIITITTDWTNLDARWGRVTTLF